MGVNLSEKERFSRRENRLGEGLGFSAFQEKNLKTGKVTKGYA